jgi:hypothetical protein
MLAFGIIALANIASDKSTAGRQEEGSALKDPQEIQVPQFGEMVFHGEPRGPEDIPQAFDGAFMGLPSGSKVLYVQSLAAEKQIGWSVGVLSEGRPSEVRSLFVRLLKEKGVRVWPNRYHEEDIEFESANGSGIITFHASSEDVSATRVSIYLVSGGSSAR